MPPPRSRKELAGDVWRLMFDYLIATSASREESLGRRNLTPNDSRALYRLSETEGAPIGQLAREWKCDPSNATWIVDRLEKAGLAERRPSPADRRVKLVFLTALGSNTMKELMAEFHDPPAGLLSLSRADLETLDGILRKLAET